MTSPSPSPSTQAPLDDWLYSELTRREEAQNYLSGYAAYALEMVPALHHRIICAHIDALLADEYDDLVICTPPGAAKSSYTSHALGSYFMGRWPRRNVILATHTADLSEKWSRKVRNTVADQKHLALFPDSHPLPRQHGGGQVGDVGGWGVPRGGRGGEHPGLPGGLCHHRRSNFRV